MILLDTNVVSEPMRPSPQASVIAWLDAQSLETMYLSAITVAELRAGTAMLPAGKRRSHVQEAVEKNLLPCFIGRVLPFDLACTNAYAHVLALARKNGDGISTADACIAAIAMAKGLSVATRDTQPFESVGLNVINPWRM